MVKKILYVLLLIAEFIVDFLLMSLAWANTFEIPCIITVVICAALLVWQIVLLTKAKDSTAKGKLFRNIALVMLLPIVAFFIMLVWFIVGLMSVI